jgi:hypothetical protein
VTFREELTQTDATAGPRQRKRQRPPLVLLFAAAVVGALITLITIWGVDSSRPAADGPNALHAGFDFRSFKIIDQLGTVQVNIWVKNAGAVTTSGTCAVMVRSGTGPHFYRGSSAFAVTSLEPHRSRQYIEVVTGVYYDGDATGPIGNLDRPLPQYARLRKGSLVACT